MLNIKRDLPKGYSLYAVRIVKEQETEVYFVASNRDELRLKEEEFFKDFNELNYFWEDGYPSPRFEEIRQDSKTEMLRPEECEYLIEGTLITDYNKALELIKEKLEKEKREYISPAQLKLFKE